MKTKSKIFILLVLVVSAFSSCDNGSKYIGQWFPIPNTGGVPELEITKVGNGYSVDRHDGYSAPAIFIAEQGMLKGPMNIMIAMNASGHIVFDGGEYIKK